MKKITKSALCFLLAVITVFSLAGCSKVQMTEDNILQTVIDVETALKDFDEETLKKYVDSKTLDVIIQYAEKHIQFEQLGTRIFESMTMNVESVDTEKQTVTVRITNYDYTSTASIFVSNLKSSYTPVQLMNKIDDENFLNSQLSELVELMGMTSDEYEKTVTLKVEKGKRNLVLVFDEEAEDAVSGGALSSIKDIYK